MVLFKFYYFCSLHCLCFWFRPRWSFCCFVFLCCFCFCLHTHADCRTFISVSDSGFHLNDTLARSFRPRLVVGFELHDCMLIGGFGCHLGHCVSLHSSELFLLMFIRRAVANHKALAYMAWVLLSPFAISAIQIGQPKSETCQCWYNIALFPVSEICTNTTANSSVISSILNNIYWKVWKKERT